MDSEQVNTHWYRPSPTATVSMHRLDSPLGNCEFRDIGLNSIDDGDVCGPKNITVFSV
jgi:hypothetical protein